jgi:hypothetical protein
MIKENIQIVGTPTFKLYDEQGELKYQFTKKNMIVTSGILWIVSRLKSNTANVMSHIGVGSGTTAPALSNTALETPIVRSAMITAGGTLIGESIVYNVTYPPGIGTGTISEAGVFNAASAGTMLSRVVFTPFTKAAADTLTIEWAFTQG